MNHKISGINTCGTPERTGESTDPLLPNAEIPMICGQDSGHGCEATDSVKGSRKQLNFHLLFLNEARHVQEVWKADFESEHTAICWMWIVGGVRALKHDWSVMELWCRRCCEERVPTCPRTAPVSGECCIARIPARDLRPSSKSERPQPRARPLILIVERNDRLATSYESMIRDAGFSVGASWSNFASAGKWLSAHSPDAAIIGVDLQDKTCIDLAKKLAEREIPYLVVSGFPADAPGINRIFRSVPWLAKPVTPAGLQLALQSIL